MAMPRKLALPLGADKLGRRLLRMVLATREELSKKSGLSRDQLKRALRYLIKRGLVASAELGCLLPGVRRYWLTPEGLQYFGASDSEKSWHGPAGVANLILHDLAKVEGVTSVASAYCDDGSEWDLWGIHWFKENPDVKADPMVAASEYNRADADDRAYVVFCFESMMDTERELVGRLLAIPAAVREHVMEGPEGNFSPAGLAIVAADHWGATRALRMACAVLPGWVPPDRITAWYYSGRADRWVVSTGQSVRDGKAPVDVPPLVPSALRIRPTISMRRLGYRRTLASVIARSQWSGRAGRRKLRLITRLGEFPVGFVVAYQRLIGDKDWKETRNLMGELEKLGLVEKVPNNGRAGTAKGVPKPSSRRGRKGPRYALAQSGRTYFCAAHGGIPVDLPKRTKMGRLRATKEGVDAEVDIWPYEHEDTVCYVLGQAAEKNCPFAPGWRARTSLANRQRIDPDAVILLGTPWGLVWCFLEVEFSDRSYLAAKSRCEKYSSEHRRDNFPVLVICPTELAERNFQKAGMACAPPPILLTTTVRRLMSEGLFGPEVWSNYGVPVTLTAPETGKESEV